MQVLEKETLSYTKDAFTFLVILEEELKVTKSAYLLRRMKEGEGLAQKIRTSDLLGEEKERLLGICGIAIRVYRNAIECQNYCKNMRLL